MWSFDIPDCSFRGNGLPRRGPRFTRKRWECNKGRVTFRVVLIGVTPESPDWLILGGVGNMHAAPVSNEGNTCHDGLWAPKMSPRKSETGCGIDTANFFCGYHQTAYLENRFPNLAWWLTIPRRWLPIIMQSPTIPCSLPPFLVSSCIWLLQKSNWPEVGWRINFFLVFLCPRAALGGGRWELETFLFHLWYLPSYAWGVPHLPFYLLGISFRAAMPFWAIQVQRNVFKNSSNWL